MDGAADDKVQRLAEQVVTVRAGRCSRRTVCSVVEQQEDPVHDEEFISEVQARAGMKSRNDAERAIRAALTILSEQLSDEVAGSVAAVLPGSFGEHLRGPRSRSIVAAAQAGRLSRGVAEGEGSWPGDVTVADADIDDGRIDHS
jgi:uncharacterized protein (DUF2267 family)